MSHSIQVNLDLSGSFVNLLTLTTPDLQQKEWIHSLEHYKSLLPISCRLDVQCSSDSLSFTYFKHFEEEEEKQLLNEPFLRGLSDHIANLLVKSNQLDLLRIWKDEGKELWFYCMYYSRNHIYDDLHRDRCILISLTYISEIPCLSPEFVLLNSPKSEKPPTWSAFLERLHTQTVTQESRPYAVMRTLLEPYSSVLFLDPLMYHATPFCRHPIGNRIQAKIYHPGASSIESISLVPCRGRVSTASIPVTSEKHKRTMLTFLFSFEDVFYNASIHTHSSSVSLTVKYPSLCETDSLSSISVTPEELKQGAKLEAQLIEKGYLEEKGISFFFQS